MAPPLVPDTLSSAFDSSTSKIGAMVDQARDRIRERARDAVRGGLAAATGPRTTTPAVPARVTAQPLPAPERDRPVAIRLRNGRQIQAALTPAVARRSDLEAVVRASGENNRRIFGALEKQREAIHRLTRAQRELAAKVEALQKQADNAVMALTQGLAQSSKQLQRVAEQGQKLLAETGSAARTAAGQLQQVQTFAATQQAQNLTNVISTAQSTAYGERGSVLSRNNLLLTGNQLLWTLLPTLSRAFGASIGASTTLGWLAPLGNLVTGYAAVGSTVPERQQPRFITGIAVFNFKLEVSESLRDRFVDDEHFQEFRKRTDVPVTVTLLEPLVPVLISASVNDGSLHIVIIQTESELKKFLRVAWMIDTGVNGG